MNECEKTFVETFDTLSPSDCIFDWMRTANKLKLGLRVQVCSRNKIPKETCRDREDDMIPSQKIRIPGWDFNRLLPLERKSETLKFERHFYLRTEGYVDV